MSDIKVSLPKLTASKLILIVVVLIAMGGVAAAGYFYYQFRTLTASSREATDLYAKVNKILELPDETPTLATVAEKEKLQDQPFFERAENGDKVLIFPTAQKAVLYRPSTKKVIEVAPFVTQPVTEQPDINAEGEQAAAPVEENLGPATVTVLNGTTQVGLANVQDDVLKAKIPELEIRVKAQARRTDYPGTIIVDVSGKRSALVQQIAEQFGGSIVQTMPGDEAKPTTDIVVLLGKDKMQAQAPNVQPAATTAPTQ